MQHWHLAAATSQALQDGRTTRNFLTFVKPTGSAYACRSQDMEDGPIVFKVTTHKSRSVT